MAAVPVAVVLLLWVRACCGYDILAVFAHGAASHFRVFEPVLAALVERGHNLTVISHYPITSHNHTWVSVRTPQNLRVESVNLQGDRFTSVFHKYSSQFYIRKYIEQECGVLEHKNMRDFLNSSKTFDVILIEDFSTDCLLGLVHRFQAPFIGLSPCELVPWLARKFANPFNPAYVPNVFLPHGDRMTFLERVENTALTLVNLLYYDYVMDAVSNRIARRYFGDHLPALSEIAAGSSLLLVNTNVNVNRPRPLVPGVVQVGGVHLKSEGPISKKIEKWISESEPGVIYFSMGSMIKGHTFPEDKRRAFLRAFGRLKQRVLWKWENDTMPGKPDNVMIQKWMPQFDILCHPNVKAFISHGGLLGTTEAVHCGVPVVVMPQFGDQHTNARALEASGGGVVLNFADITEESVYQALQTVLNPEFNKKAKELSERFRDRPMPPLETAIYWIEYVARHKGAHHMRTAAVGMPFYQYLLLDVIAFLLAVVAIWMYLSFIVMRAVWRRCCRGKKEKTKVKKN